MNESFERSEIRNNRSRRDKNLDLHAIAGKRRRKMNKKKRRGTDAPSLEKKKYYLNQRFTRVQPDGIPPVPVDQEVVLGVMKVFSPVA